MWLSGLRTRHSVREDGGSVPGLTRWLKIWRCRKLPCRPQMRFRSGIAVAVVWAFGNSSDLTPRLGTSVCCRCSPKKGKKKKKE